MRWWLGGALVLAAMLLQACSPTFNWRDVWVGDGLKVLLPCQPDQGARSVPLDARQSVEIDMVGCKVGDLMFAVAHMDAADGAQAAERMGQWQQATRATWAGSEVAQQPAEPQGASVAAPAMRWTIQAPAGQAANGAGSARMMWFAQERRGGQVALYQMMLLGDGASEDISSMFFDSAKLQR